MQTYTPIDLNNPDEVQDWVNWLEDRKDVLNGQPEYTDNQILQTEGGDVSAVKDLVGNLLALLTNTQVTIY